MAESVCIAAEDRPLVAVLEQDPATRHALDQTLKTLGHRADYHGSPELLLAKGYDRWALACVSLDENGLGLMEQLRDRHPRLPIVVLATQPSAVWAVEAMRVGASDCIIKPLERARIRTVLGRLLEHRAPALSTEALSTEAIVGGSACIRELQVNLARAAGNEVGICLRGETGTGKELVARAIHALSGRSKGPFVAVNCAAIPSQLQESVFFGHERGAFTGAVAAHKGRFEQAHNGTLLLDELGEMSLATQAMLLRALDERKVQRVGGTAEVPVNIRVICSTHRDLEAEVSAGRFREDLYYRLNVYRIDLPPLRQRLEDLPALVECFLSRAATGPSGPPRMSKAAFDVLRAHNWPGNVRELQSVVLCSALVSDGREIVPANLPASVHCADHPAQALPDGADDVHLPFREIERRAILRAMKANNGNVDKSARLLGMSRATVYRRLTGFAVASGGSKK